MRSGLKQIAADIDRRFQWFMWWRRTGVWPFGAQVARTDGVRANPLSSWKAIHAPLARAFFYLGPALVGPPLDGLVVALDGPAGRALA